ncbi:MAG: M20/M25/M40 family metallo-hydrolase [Planctomycetota bacterium]
MNRVEVSTDQAIDRFVKLTAIEGRSGQEAAVAEHISQILIEAGLDKRNIRFDGAETRTRLKGDCGNLIVELPGTDSDRPSTLLSAHMDTVPVCLGSRPVVEGDYVISDSETGLGADNRSGCCAVLTAAVERLRSGIEDLAPAKLLFTIQEEVGLEGARHLDVSSLGQIDRAINFDGGNVDKLTTGAIGGERMEIQITGLPAHAGLAPQEGISAIVIAAKAIASLDEQKWLGRVEKESGKGTSNVGVIQGGEATNVVTPELFLKAEARSHQAEFRTEIVRNIREAFEQAASQVTNDSGVTGSVTFESHVDYESFRLDDDDPSVVAAEKCLKAIGREPFRAVANGGLDANWLFRHGIHAVTIGCGQLNIHTADEKLFIPDYLDACRLATAMICE